MRKIDIKLRKERMTRERIKKSNTIKKGIEETYKHLKVKTIWPSAINFFIVSFV